MNLPYKVNDNLITFGNFNIEIKECSSYCFVQLGKESKAAGALASEAINKVLDNYLSENFSAMVTMPISKNSLLFAEKQFTSHTDILKAYFEKSKPMMLFYYDNMITALATIHIALQEVPNAIQPDILEERIEVLNQALTNDFNILNPTIAVLSLNPHSGENGLMGDDEQKKIVPAINRCRTKGIRAEGPFPSDGFYGFGEYKKFHAVLAMYHDQGLIPMKLLSKGNAVNFTANIPIVRTSPDHGTAFSIAGKNIASAESTIEAIKLAVEIANNRTNK